MRFLKDVLLVLQGRDDLGDKFIMDPDGTEEARECVARFARGNIALQSGAFVTDQELERERQQMARHSF